MAFSNIADELMSAVNRSNYCEYVQCLSERDAVDIQTFQYTPMGKNYWIDLRRCFNNSEPNHNHVLELFGEFSGFDPSELRQRAVTILSSKTEIPYWSHAGSVLLGLNFRSYSDWLEHMSKDSSPCDELMLYVLNRIHHRHTVVYTSNRIWTTVQADDKLTEVDLMSICDLRLVYLGNKIFGELKKLPMCAPPLLHVPQLTFHKSTKISRKGKAMNTHLPRSIKSLQDKCKKHTRTRVSEGVIIEKKLYTPVTFPMAATAQAPLHCPAVPTSMTAPTENVPFSTTPCRQALDDQNNSTTKRIAEPGLNSSDAVSSVAEAPRRLLPSKEETDNTVDDIILPNSNYSNNIPSTAEELLASPSTVKSPANDELCIPTVLHADGHLCLNSSNISTPSVLKNPNRLCTLVRSYMVSTMFLNIRDIDNYLLICAKPSAKMPLSLKTIVTTHIRTHYSNIDLDDAMTGILKTNILRKYEVRAQETALESNLNKLLKNLALKRKLKVTVLKLDKTAIKQPTKEVPHWSELDPYSDLEEQCESGNTSTYETASPDGIYFTKIGGHVLRKRHHSYSCTQTWRLCTGYTYYRDMCSTSNENLKPKKKKIVPKKEPSSARLRSQSLIKNKTDQVNRNFVQSYPMHRVKRINTNQKSDHGSESESA